MNLPPAIGLDGAEDTDAPRRLTIPELMDTFTKIAKETVKIGSLELIVQADPSRGQAVVTVRYANTTVDKQLLTYSNAQMELDVATGKTTATGKITLKLKPSPQFSSLTADLVVVDGNGSYPYKGALKSWVAEGEPVVGDYLRVLGGELSTITTVRGVAANIADFCFSVGGQSLASMTATQLAPVQKWPDAIVSGDIRIEAGAQISLTIPTTLEKGFLFLTAEFRTRTTPRTPIGSSVANWSLPSASSQSLKAARGLAKAAKHPGHCQEGGC